MNFLKAISFSVFIIIWLSGASQNYQLVWSDEFDVPGSPNADKWSFEIGAGGWGNSELQYYTNRQENARIENGHLVITARKESYSGAVYTSARMVSRNKGDWKYGKIEVRAKLAGGKGSWPAIWMLPTDWVYGGWPASGEIDIMEHVGYDATRVFGTAHTKDFNHTLGTQQGSNIIVTNCETEFNNYSIVWTNDKIDFYVNDTKYFTFNKQTGWEKWPFDQRFHLLLNVAVGGSWGGAQGVDENIFPTSMEIDYVRVYQELTDLTLSGPAFVHTNENATFSAPNIPAATYQWSVPADVQIVSGQNTSEIKVIWGNTDADITLNLTLNSELNTLTKSVSVIAEPLTGQYFISDFSDGKTTDISFANQTENKIQITEANSELRIDYQIAKAGLNPYILFTFPKPVSLKNVANMWLNLKTFNKSGSVITRFDFIDINGNATDKTPVFKIEQPVSDGQYHEYSYGFASRWNSLTGSNNKIDSTSITALKMYINYGFFGKDNASDSLWIKNMHMSDIKASVYASNKKISNVTVYPNPAQNQVFINIPDNLQKGTNWILEIINSQGHIIRSENFLFSEKSINLSELPDGIYYLKISSDTNILTSKIIKN